MDDPKSNEFDHFEMRLFIYQPFLSLGALPVIGTGSQWHVFGMMKTRAMAGQTARFTFDPQKYLQYAESYRGTYWMIGGWIFNNYLLNAPMFDMLSAPFDSSFYNTLDALDEHGLDGNDMAGGDAQDGPLGVAGDTMILHIESACLLLGWVIAYPAEALARRAWLLEPSTQSPVSALDGLFAPSKETVSNLWNGLYIGLPRQLLHSRIAWSIKVWLGVPLDFNHFVTSSEILPADPSNLARYFSAQHLADFLASLATYPLEVVETRMMVQRDNRYSGAAGVLKCASELYVAEGWAGFLLGIEHAVCGMLFDKIVCDAVDMVDVATYALFSLVTPFDDDED